MSARMVPLRLLAHGRAGDKGNRLNISVIAHDAAHYEHLVAQVTEAFCAEAFASRRPSAVRRYLLPKLAAMNIVFDDVLEGGVNSSLCLDRHGKGLSYLLLDALLPAPKGWAGDTSPTSKNTSS